MKKILRRIALNYGYQIQKISLKSQLFEPSKSIVVSFLFEDEEVTWFVENPLDHIQSMHLSGDFFEIEELKLIRKHYNKSGIFVDIGANVGNHSIFVSKMIGGPGVIAFEPGIKQHSIFCVNIALNKLGDHIKLHRFGLSDKSDVLAMNHGGAVNLGRARVTDGLAGEIVSLEVGDEVLGGESISFIKIDVEGHELSVLRGLGAIIRTNHPKILIEVEQKNEESFQKILEQYEYMVIEKIDHTGHLNFLIGPK